MTAAGSRQQIPDEDWETIVRHVPIVSVDLIVRDERGVLLGKRRNNPAKGEWFVPGGTVFKNERIREAVHRVAQGELGTDVTIDRSLGTFEQFYDTSDTGSVDGKHYLATAFVVDLRGEPVLADDQHSEFRFFRPPLPDLHPYIERYFDAVGLSD